MKREAHRHPKMLDLASRLGIDRARAIGIVTLLFDFTADMSPQGNVGKWPDGAISRACEWGTMPTDASHDALAFIAALVDAGWLDRDDAARLLVHDWPDHCERYVKSKLVSLGMPFHISYSSRSEDVSRDVSRHTSSDAPRACAGAYAHDQTKPNQTKPQPVLNQTKPDRNSISKNGGLAGGEDLELWNTVAGRLAKLGASRWRESVETAKAAGCSAEHVGELLDFAVARKISVGAICFRLTRAHPSLAVELGWPDRAEKSKKSAATKNSEMSVQAKKNRAFEIRTLMRGKDDSEIEKAIRAEKLEEFL